MIDLPFREKHFAGVVQKLSIFHPAAQTRKTQMGEGIGEQMHIQAASIHALGIAAVCRSSKFRFGHGAAINGTAVVLHPVSIHLKRFFGAVIQITSAGGTYIHQQVAAAGDGVDQHADEHFRGFPGLLVPIVAPGAGKGLTGLPGDKLSCFRMGHPLSWLILFRRPEILVDSRPVVDDDAGLERTGEIDELFSLPVVLSLALHPGPVSGSVVVTVGEIKPQDVDFSVIGQKLCNLIAHILCVLLHVAALALLEGIRIIPAGMVHVDGKLRMMPVDQGIVESDTEPLRPEGVHIFTHQIPAAGSIGGLVIRIFAVKQTEALMMLGGQNRVFHARGLCLPRPVTGIAEIRIEMFKIEVIFLLRNFLTGFDPFMACGQCVKTEVDEHSETVMGKPCGVAGCFAGYIA